MGTYFELEVEAPPARKRPAFREKKPEALLETAAAANGSEAERLRTDKREDRDRHSRRAEDKPDRPALRPEERKFKRDAYFQRSEMQKGGYQSRKRFDGGATRGRDRIDGRYGDRSTHRHGRFQAEKWRHYIFEEANGSAPPESEEEQIAEIEALLAQ